MWLAGPAAASLHRGQNSAQYVNLVLVGRRPVEEAPQPGHQLSAARAVPEIDLVEYLRELLVEPLHFLRGRMRPRGDVSASAARLTHGEPELVRDDLYRHREIQRCVSLAAGDGEQPVALLEIVVRETGAFRPEQQRNRRALPGGDDFPGPLARLGRPPRRRPTPGRRGA